MNSFRYKLFCLIINIIGILVLCTGCSNTKDISENVPYNQCIGKKFILKEDMYIFRFNDSTQFLIAGPNSGVSGLTKFVDPKYIGKNSGRLTIKNIVKKGTVFSIVKVIEVHTFETSYISFLINFDNTSLSKENINTTCILNLNNPPNTKIWSDPPIFKADLVESLPSDGVWWK